MEFRAPEGDCQLRAEFLEWLDPWCWVWWVGGEDYDLPQATHARSASAVFMPPPCHRPEERRRPGRSDRALADLRAC